MIESNALINEVRAWMYLPSKLFAIGSPPAFILFGPKEYVDFVLQSHKPPEILNPWVGLIFLYATSFFIFHVISRIYWRIAAWWYGWNKEQPGH